MDWLAALIVFALAPLPIVEIRLSLVLGITRYNLNPWLTCAIVVLSNLLFVLIAWAVLPAVERAFRKVGFLDRFLDWLFAKTRKEVSHRRKVLEELGMFAIVALIAVPFPLPGSGIYTALVAAYVFGFSMRKVFPWIAAGVVAASAAFTLVVLAGNAVFGW